jgi:hypothetical protein
LGASVQHGGPIVSKFVGIACESIGRAQVWPNIDRLNADQARAAAKRVEDIIGLHVPIADTLEVEKYGNLVSISQMFERRDWRLKLTDYSGNVASPSASLAGYFALLPHSKREIIARYSRLADRTILIARKPYYQIAAQPGRDGTLMIVDQELQKEADKDPVTALFFPTFSHARLQDEIDRTQNALLATKLALQAFRCDRHRNPRSLAELVPEYLTAVPQDPFGHGQPLAYRMASIDGAPTGPVIYGVGPDLRDDGGVPAIDWGTGGRAKNMAKLTAKELAAIRIVRDRSKGDIVAGINTK